MSKKIYDEKLEDYLRGLIETLMRKYSFSKKEAAHRSLYGYLCDCKCAWFKT